MVLTKDDLLAVSQLLDSKLQPMYASIMAEIADLKNRVSAREGRVSALEDRMTALEDRMTALEGRVSALEMEVLSLEDRVSALEIEVSELGRKVTLTNLEIENDIRPHIQLLAENYVPAAKRYEKTSAQVEEMHSDIDVMKKVITKHSETLQRLA